MKKIIQLFFINPKEKHPAFLSVIENRKDLLERFVKRNPNLRLKKSWLGYNLIFLAKHLDRQECLKILLPEKSPSGEDYGLSHLIFEKYSFLEKTVDTCRNVKAKLTREKLWLAAYYKQAVSKNIHPEFRILQIDSYLGRGVFALKDIPKGVFLGEYTGVVKKRKRKVLKNNVYCLRYPVGFDKGKRYIIDASKKGNHTRFINHSDTPNSVLQSVIIEDFTRMIFLSSKPIKKGEQVTFDYGTLFWKQQKEKPIKL